MRDGASSGGSFPVHRARQAGRQAKSIATATTTTYEIKQLISVEAVPQIFFCSIEDAKNFQKKGVI